MIIFKARVEHLFREDDLFTAVINKILFGGPSTKYICCVFPVFIRDIMNIADIESIKSTQKILDCINSFIEKMHEEIMLFPS